MLLFEGARPVVDNKTITAINENNRQQTSIDTLKQQFYEFGIFEAEQVVAIANSAVKAGQLANSLGFTNEVINEIVNKSTEVLGAQSGLYSSNGPVRQLGISLPNISKLITENFQTSDFYLVGSGDVTIDTRSTEIIKVIEAIAIGTNVNFTQMSGRAYNQWSHPTCAAFAATSSNEFRITYLVNNYLQGVAKLSPAWLYCETKRIDRIAYQDGTTLEFIAEILRTHGQAKHTLYPYNETETNVCRLHNYLQQLNQNDALNYRAGTICINPNKVEALKKVITAKFLPYVSIRLHENVWNSRTSECGVINMPLVGENIIGGHAVCLVGYFESHLMPGNGAFIFKNSWGESWAYNSYVSRAGYGALPFKYIEEHCTEAYAAV